MSLNGDCLVHGGRDTASATINELAAAAAVVAMDTNSDAQEDPLLEMADEADQADQADGVMDECTDVDRENYKAFPVPERREAFCFMIAIALVHECTG